jgi:hypothetical protein
MAEAKKNGWTVISMKNDWKAIFLLMANEWARPKRFALRGLP